MTLARTRSAPTIGSIIRTTSLASSRSIFSWRSITAALSGSSPSPLGRASGRPVLSMRQEEEALVAQVRPELAGRQAESRQEQMPR